MGMPDFICIGGQRSGSTGLHVLLQRHPAISVPDSGSDRWGKELKFFNLEILRRDFTWYEAQFSSVQEGQVCGELSPEYATLDRRVVELVARYLPSHTRLIYIARNPLDRVFSQFKMRISGFGRLRLDESKVTLHNLIRFCQRWECIAHSRPTYTINAWSAAFEAGAMKVVLFDDLVSGDRKAIRDICGHLGVNSEFDPGLSGAVHASERLLPTSEMRRYLSLRWLNEVRRLNTALGGAVTHWQEEMTGEIQNIGPRELARFRAYEVCAMPTRVRSYLQYRQSTQRLRRRLTNLLQGTQPFSSEPRSCHTSDTISGGARPRATGRP